MNQNNSEEFLSDQIDKISGHVPQIKPALDANTKERRIRLLKALIATLPVPITGMPLGILLIMLLDSSSLNFARETWGMLLFQVWNYPILVLIMYFLVPRGKTTLLRWILLLVESAILFPILIMGFIYFLYVLQSF